MSDELELLGVRAFGDRSYTVEDLTIRSDGDGRTVEAYAAAFNVPAEIRDSDGHYIETLTRGAFSKTIADKGTSFGVFYNHARTLHGTPDGNLSVPIGVPLEAPVQDTHGVFTVTRYLDNPLADSILDGIKQRAIRGQSFSGRFIKSTRTRATARGGLPSIARSEVDMTEYGPTVFPAYKEAHMVGTRSVDQFLAELAQIPPEDLERFRQMLGIATPLEPAGAAGTSSEAAPPQEPAAGHSLRHSHLRLEWRKRKDGNHA